MTIYRAGQKTPPGFSLTGEKNINKTMEAKIIPSVVITFVLAISTVHAGTIKPVSPSTSGFSTLSGGPSSGPQLSLNGDGIFTTPPTFNLPPVSSGSFGPVSGGPGPVTTQPVVPAARAVPDSGSTVMLFALALLGLAVTRSKLIRT
jgi:hypothetical protein